LRTLVQTGNLPPGERLAHWRAAVLRLPVPVEIRAATSDLRVQLKTADLGQISVMLLRSRTSFEFHRTRLLIRRSDPESYRLVLALRGNGGLAHEDRDVRVHPGDLVLFDTSRPFGGWLGADETVERLVLEFPRPLLPLPARMAGRLVGVRLPGQTGLARLTSSFLRQAAEQADILESSDGPRAATVTVDLLAALLAHELEADSNLTPPESRRHALVLQIHDFIASRLSDADLSPDAIAAAHHISTRQLHKLFSTQDQTVAAWVRSRRLAACQRDLADPLLWEQPVHAIAAKWGFTSAAHFSRVFRAAYGVTAQDFRRQVAAGRAPRR
jgi:AraC-like DNA-binding protein